MEKLGVDQTELLENLRNEEANLMQQMQTILSGSAHEKVAADRSNIETRLGQVRSKITELDLKSTES